MTGVRSTIVVAAAASKLADVVFRLEGHPEAMRGGPGDHDGSVVLPVSAAGPDGSVTVDTFGLGADASADLLAHDFSDAQIAGAFVGRMELDRVAPHPDDWHVVPNPAAADEALVNGRAISGATPLRDGDVLAVRREAKGVVKLPFRASFEPVAS